MTDDNRLGAFLRARRELVRPGDVGLQGGGRRRVHGLRREELALLAGVSADYYMRLEQGRDRHPSDAVLDALARVLRLDEPAVRHLHALARPSTPSRRARTKPERVTPGLQALLASWSHTPALVLGRHLDVLAYNPLAAAVYHGISLDDNLVRMVFMQSGARCIYAEWDRVADNTVGSLRAIAGADIDHPRLTELVGELCLKSDEFRRRWARHDVADKTSGTKKFLHPEVGEMTLHYETFSINGASGQQLVVNHADPGSDTERALARLAARVTGRTANLTVVAPAANDA